MTSTLFYRRWWR